MATQHGNVRELDDGPYHIVIAAQPVLGSVGGGVRGYDITTQVRRADGTPVKGTLLNEIRHVGGAGLDLGQALDHGERFVRALIEHGFPESDDFWKS
ncbi:hypothetical protein [Burkholderia gladioli]|uniref:hypothetical protein n=1 Tax=Burkholderia gladioli TaxID=28095 RepID=UPI00163EFA01|nr:hypothetical protein [Burkholderia gladioli]